MSKGRRDECFNLMPLLQVKEDGRGRSRRERDDDVNEENGTRLDNEAGALLQQRQPISLSLSSSYLQLQGGFKF